MASSNVEITSYIPDWVEATDLNRDGQAAVLPAEQDSDNDRLDDRFDTVFGGMSVENAGGSSVELPDRNGDGKPDQVDAGAAVKVLRVYLPVLGR